MKEKEEWRKVFKSNNIGKCIIIELNTKKLKKIRENLIKKVIMKLLNQEDMP